MINRGNIVALAGVACGSAGFVYESTVLLVMAILAALVGMVLWARATAPHNHWRGLRRRKRWDT